MSRSSSKILILLLIFKKKLNEYDNELLEIIDKLKKNKGIILDKDQNIKNVMNTINTLKYELKGTPMEIIKKINNGTLTVNKDYMNKFQITRNSLKIKDNESIHFNVYDKLTPEKQNIQINNKNYKSLVLKPRKFDINKIEQEMKHNKMLRNKENKNLEDSYSNIRVDDLTEINYSTATETDYQNLFQKKRKI